MLNFCNIIGILDPPSLTEVKFINDDLSLQWSQPYSLDNVPINDYHIIIMSNNSIITNAIHTNDTNSIIIENITSRECSDYDIRISASNNAGESENSFHAVFYSGGMHRSDQYHCITRLHY